MRSTEKSIPLGGAAVKPSSAPDQSGVSLLDLAIAVLDDGKAENIVSIDLTGKTAMADYMVVASGRSHRHVSSVADQLMKRIRDLGIVAPRVEGLLAGDWVLIDVGDVIVHLFMHETRAFYNLEKMWTSHRPAPQTFE